MHPVAGDFLAAVLARDVPMADRMSTVAMALFPLDSLIERLARVIEISAVVAIVAGLLVAVWLFLSHAARRADIQSGYRRLRVHLGRTILLGLEILIAADIVRTVALDRSFANLGVLAVIVLIRTFLSFTLEVETKGEWPWQSGGEERDAAAR